MGSESTSLMLNVQREGTDGVSMRVQLGFWRHEATVQQKGKAWRSRCCLCLKDKEDKVARAELIRET